MHGRKEGCDGRRGAVCMGGERGGVHGRREGCDGRRGAVCMGGERGVMGGEGRCA